MEFQKFSSLENTYRQNLIDKVQYEGKDGGLWIATEKLHGANFSFWCDGTEVKVASRTQFVDGTFFNCQAVINKYQDKVMSLWEVLSKTEDWTDLTLVIYGELFGGNIQKEVEYDTEQRVCNVVSKFGHVTNKDFGKMLGLTVQDILEDFTRETEREPKVEAEDNWKQFNKLLSNEVGKTVRVEFL